MARLASRLGGSESPTIVSSNIRSDAARRVPRWPNPGHSRKVVVRLNSRGLLAVVSVRRCVAVSVGIALRRIPRDRRCSIDDVLRQLILTFQFIKDVIARFLS